MFDVLILGGGTAGCRLAAQLAEDATRQVALLEAGPAPSRRRPRPARRLDTVAQPGLNGRHVALLAGTGLGGAAAWGEGAPAALPQWPNLHLFCDATAVRVLLRGRRAVGAEFHRAGLVQQVHAQHTVLCAGPLATPALLLRSGIGPHAHLVAAGVATRLDLPGVGLGLRVPVALRLPVGRGARWRDWLGWGGVGPPAGAVAPPDSPLLWQWRPDALQLQLTAPASHGSLRLQGKDPEQPPRLDPDLLSEREDLDAWLHALRVAGPWLAAQGLRPGGTWARLVHDLALERWLRDQAVPAPGASGGCGVGDGPLDVLDAQLRVRGIDSLYVADASALPAPDADREALAARALQLLSRPASR